MARQSINIGSQANDGTGDDLRTAMHKINTNFTELYAETAVDSGITISGNTISSNRSDDDIVFEPSGAGAVRFPAVTINDNSITGTRSNEDLTISAAGTGNLILGSLRVNGTTVSSDDSTKITLAESVDITGTLTAAIFQVNELSSSDSSAIQVNDGLNVSGTLSADVLDVNEISSGDSSAIQVNDGLNVSGTLVASSFVTNTIISNDSSAIQILDGLNVSGAITTNSTFTANGTLTANTIVTNDISSGDSTAIQINDGLNVSGILTATGLVANGITYPTTDGSTNQVLITNGSGILSFTSLSAFTGLTFVGDDSTGSTINTAETLKFAGATGITTSVVNDTVTITGPNLSAYLTNSPITVVGDDSTGTTLNTGETIKIAGTSNITTAVSGDTLTITGSKDIDINSISSTDSTAIQINDGVNITGTLTANIFVTNSITSNDSSAIQINDAVNISGTLSADVLDVNEISSSDSSAIQINDAVNIAGNIVPSADNTYDLGSSTSRWKDLHVMEGTIYMWDFFNNYRAVTAQKIALLDAMISGGLQYSTDPYGGDAVITNQYSNNGVSIQGNSGAPVTVNEIEVTAATITPTTPDTLELVGTTIVDELQVEGNEITPTANDTYIVLTPTGTGKVTVDTLDIKNGEITPNTANTNITLSPSGTGRIVLNTGSTEKINPLTSSLTITVNCALAPVHKVTLNSNTQFVITNLPTGGSVKLIITQDGGGSRTATFGTESSTAVRFPGGAPTLTAAAGSIDMVTIFNDGVNYLGELKANYIP